MGSFSKWALAGCVCGTALSFAPAQGITDAPSANTAEIRFADGSVVRMTILQPAIDIQTKYGQLTVPICDIRRIDFGLHLPPGADQRIEKNIKRLGSEVFRDREEATRELIALGPVAYPFVLRATRDADLETTQRINMIAKRIAEKCTPEDLKIKEDDVIHTQDFPIVGRIMAPALAVRSVHFGELALKLSDLKTLYVRGINGELELSVEAARYGSTPEQWLDTGIIIDSSQTLLLSSEGQIDLWPQGPGQYVSGPKGYSAVGRVGNFMAGSLLARVGENGKSFAVGDRYEGTPGEEGKVYLSIAPSPWNNAASGAYRVRVSTERVALSAKR